MPSESNAYTLMHDITTYMQQLTMPHTICSPCHQHGMHAAAHKCSRNVSVMALFCRSLRSQITEGSCTTT